MGFGVNERLDKQAKYEKTKGKSKVKLVMKKAKKQPKNISKVSTASDKKEK